MISYIQSAVLHDVRYRLVFLSERVCFPLLDRRVGLERVLIRNLPIRFGAPFQNRSVELGLSFQSVIHGVLREFVAGQCLGKLGTGLAAHEGYVSGYAFVKQFQAL
ncbi:hypothetical protein D1872_282270 [compost metagenome]